MPPFFMEESVRIRIPANLGLALFLSVRRRTSPKRPPNHGAVQKSILFLRAEIGRNSFDWLRLLPHLFLLPCTVRDD